MIRARVQNLFKSLAIYGVGDVATNVVSLLLLPLLTKYLTPADYGVISLLLLVEAATKVLFRWGVDTAFMRLYYDCRDQAARQRLASTLLFFLLTVNGLLTMVGVAGAGVISRWLFKSDEYAPLIALTIVNTFVAGFYFIPYQVLRIGRRSTEFIALTFSRTAGTIVARLILVIGLGLRVKGVVLADIVVTTLFTLVMLRWFVPLIRPVFSRSVIRDALGFGLPRVPHSVAQQVIGFADRFYLGKFATLKDIGLYGMGATFGLMLKYFLGAFEAAWTPFFLDHMKDKDAGRTYSMVSTYVVAALVLLVAGLCAIAPEMLRIFTKPDFWSAAVVTPWIALGAMFQGVYLVGSIGLVITKRTKIYPISTGTAAVASIVANMLLIPRYGILGAAYANVIAYATLAGVTSVLSWRAYPIHYEWSRIVRIVASGGTAFLVAKFLIPEIHPAMLGLLVRGSTVIPMFAAMLYVTGFFRAGELRVLQDLRAQAMRARRPKPAREPQQVEMAGEVVATPSEPIDPDEDDEPRPDDRAASSDSRDPRR